MPTCLKKITSPGRGCCCWRTTTCGTWGSSPKATSCTWRFGDTDDYIFIWILVPRWLIFVIKVNLKRFSFSAGGNRKANQWLPWFSPLPTPAQGIDLLPYPRGVLLYFFSAHFSLRFLYFSWKDELEKEVEQSKTVNLELVFGYHWKPGTGKSVSSQKETHLNTTSTYSAAASIWCDSLLALWNQQLMNATKERWAYFEHFGNVGYFLSPLACGSCLFWRCAMVAVIPAIEGFTRHALDQTNKHFILSLYYIHLDLLTALC